MRKVTVADVLARAAANKAAAALRDRRLPNEAEQLDLAWLRAIEAWELSEPQILVELVAGEGQIPRHARAWLAQLAAGSVRKRPGRRREKLTGAQAVRKALAHWDIEARFWRVLLAEQCGEQQQHGTPKERALARCAEEFGMTEDAVSQIVYPRRGSE